MGLPGRSGLLATVATVALAATSLLVGGCDGSAADDGRADPGSTTTSTTTPSEPPRFQLMVGTDFAPGGLDPSIQARINPDYDPASPGVALAGGWGLEQVLAEGDDRTQVGPRDQLRIRSVDLDTDGVTVERLFTYRQANYDLPAESRPWSGVTGAYPPSFWNLRDVADLDPEAVLDGDDALGGVFRLEDGATVGRVTRLCIDWDERAAAGGDGGWVARSECSPLDWVFCREELESASCTAALAERAARTGQTG